MGLLSALGLKWIGRRPHPIRESLEPDDDTGWIRAFTSAGIPLSQDLDLMNGEVLLRAAKEAYQHNAIARAVIEHTTSFVLGGGALIVAADHKVQRVVDYFWNDAENHMPDRIYDLQNELSAHGELFIRFFSDPATGRTIIRPLDPLHIVSIETHPEDHEHPLSYLYQPPSTSLSLCDPTSIPAAEVLHTTINRPSSSLRGRSDLATIIPWLRLYTKQLKDHVQRTELLSLLVWDVTVKGAGIQEINALRAGHATPPPAGSVLFHNESETWKPITPDLHSQDVGILGRAIRLMIATGSGLPEHYLGEGGNANRATAAEMGLPAMKRFQRKQQIFRAFLTQLVNRVIDNAIAAGRLGPRVNRAFTVQFEELTTSPLPDVAAAVKDLTTSLSLASEKGWVTAEEARRLWWRYAAQADESAPQSSPPPTA